MARRAGVSVATVSRVLNDSSRVSEPTRRRVQDAVRTLRYVPHSGARSLITRRTRTFGVILPELYGEFFSEVIRGFDESARGHGYHLLVSSSHAELSEVEAAMRAMAGRVDGLAIMSPDLSTETVAANVPETMPVVLVNCAIRHAALDSVTIDNVGGSRAIVAHLVQHGHRRIAIINGPAHNRDAQERRRGYRAALSRARLRFSRELEFSGDFTEESGYRAATALLRLKKQPTAVFAANDSMAIGAIAALTKAGRRIPADVAVAGFDDIPIARYLTPPLSSVHVPISELGRSAIGSLVRAAENGNRHARRHDIVPTRLVVRETCGVHKQPRRPKAAGGSHARSHSSPAEAVL